MKRKHEPILKWIERNNLNIQFGININGEIYCQLRDLFSTLWVVDGICLSGVYGEGTTFDEAFENMYILYSGKVLVSRSFSSEGMPREAEYLFPIIMKESE